MSGKRLPLLSVAAWRVQFKAHKQTYRTDQPIGITVGFGDTYCLVRPGPVGADYFLAPAALPSVLADVLRAVGLPHDKRTVARLTNMMSEGRKPNSFRILKMVGQAPTITFIPFKGGATAVDLTQH